MTETSAPPQLFDTVTQARDFLLARGVDLSGDQGTKTRTALRYFAELVEN